MNAHRPASHPDTHRHGEVSPVHHETPEVDHTRGHGGHMLLMLLACVVMFAAVFLLAGGTEGGLGMLPWILLLLCPLLHLFMHRIHGEH